MGLKTKRRHFFEVLLLMAVFLWLPITGWGQAVVVNSYINNLTPDLEWTELIVIQDNINLAGWSLRDNNSAQTSWQDAIIFRDIAFWNNIRGGTIIVINHRTAGNLPVSLDKQGGYIRVNADDPNYFSGGEFPNNTLNIATGGDFLQVRNNSGNHVHGLGHKTEVGTSFEETPLPKLNHIYNLAQNEALYVCPGNELNVYGSIAPQVGTTYTAMGNSKTAGLPNPCTGNTNSEFWRKYREPSWNSPAATATYNHAQNRVTLNWNNLTDPYPTDQVQGYLVLRNTNNNFSSPVDGRIYAIGDLIGTAKVIASINPSTNTALFDNLDAAACGQTYYYRIYGYRFNGSFNNHPARGRAYNELSYATASVFIEPLVVSVSISTPLTSLPAGTEVTITASTVNAGDPSNIRWFKNNAFTGQTGLQYTFIPQDGDEVYAYVDLSPLCASQATSNTIVFEILGCDAGEITGPHFLCYNSPPTTYISNGDAGGSWSSSNTDIATVNPTSGIVTVQSAGTFLLKYSLAVDCFAEKTVSINPQANAGPDQVLCGVLTTSLIGNEPVIDGGFWAQIDGPEIIDFLPNSTSLSPTIVPRNPIYGTYLFTWALETCNSFDIVSITFNERKQVGVSVTANTAAICAGEMVTYTANPQNSGSDPVYQWFVNGIPQGNSNNASFNYIPQATDMVHVVLTSSEDCVVIGSNPATSNSVSVEVKALATAPTAIEASETSICNNFSDPIVLNAEGGSGEVFRWYSGNCGGTVLGEGTSLVIDPPPATSQTYFGRWETEGCNTSACQSVNIIVEPIIEPFINISPNAAQSICEGGSLTFVAIADPINPSPQYQWLINGNVVSGYNTASFNYNAFNDGDALQCRITYTGNGSNCILPSTVLSDPVTINVAPLVTPSIAIADAPPAVCTGSAINLTANYLNSGSSPTFQWFLNNVAIVGATSASLTDYTAFSAGTNIFKVVMTSNASCRTIDEVETEVEITANDEITPSLMISTPTTEICSGSEIAFSVDALFGGGLAPALQWRINGLDISGETGMSFLTNSLSDGDEVDCQLTSNDACATVSTVYSDAIVMQVTETLEPQITLISDLSQNNICQNTQIHFTTTTTNGGLAPQYSWFVNGTIVPDSIAAGFIFNSETPGNYSIAVSLNSSETCTTENPVLSDDISFTVLPELPVVITINANPTSVCEGSTVTINCQSSNPGPNPSYAWYRNGNLLTGVNTPNYTYYAQAGDSWQVELTSNAICAVNNPNMSNTIEPDITPLPQAPAELTADRDNICANDEGTITLTATGGVGETLQWFSEGCNGTPIGTGNDLEISSPETTTTYYARYQNSCGVSACESVTVTVNESIVPQIAIVPPTITPCDGDEVTLSTNVSGQGSNPAYSWTINGVQAGGSSPTLTASFNDDDAIVCTMLSSEACANPTAASDSYTMEMNPLLTPEISISADQTVVCEGTSILFTSIISNGGENPTYQWNINNQFLGDENSSFEFTPAPGTYTINCLLTSSESCVTQENAISNEITVTVNAAVEPLVNVTLSQNQVCTGTEVSFEATAINGGDAPVFEWYRNNALIPGESNSFLNIIPGDGDAFYCVLQSNVLCANPATVQSETFFLEVVDNIVPDIVINTETTSICDGSTVEFTSTISGGGSNPAYSWFINNVLSGTEPQLIYTPSDQDEVYCILLSSDDCANPQTANSTPIVMTVESQLEASITITADVTEVCENTPVTFEAFAINEGDNPTFTWLIDDEPAGTSIQLVQAFEAGTYVIRCEMTSDAFCVTNPTSSSNLIVLEVFTTIEPSINIETSQTNLCEGTEVQIIATVTGEGIDPALEWYVNGAPQGMNGLTFAYIPTNGDEVWCELNSDADCAAPQQVISEVITLTVSNTITPIIQIETSQNAMCAGTEISVAAYTSGGGINPSFQWFVNDQAVGENATNLYYIPNDNDFIYCVLTSSDACAEPSSISSDTIEYTVSNPIFLNEILLNDASCNENNGSVAFIITGGNGNPEYSIDSGNSWSSNPDFNNLAAGTFSYLLRDGELCTPISGQFTIAQSGSPEIDQIITSNASNGLANGSATIIAIGNNLEYSLNNVDWQQDPVFSDLAEGDYPFVIRDAKGCYIVSSFQILSDVVKLSLSDGSGCKGNELTITISTDGIPSSKELLSHLNFNHLQLQFEEAVSLHAEITQNMLTADPSIPGNLLIHYVAGNNFTIPGAADLIELRFTALEEGNSSISWSGNSFIRMGNYEYRPILTENASIAIDLGTDFSFEGINQACQGEPISIGLIADGTFDALEWYNPSGEFLTSGSSLLIPEANYSDGGLYSVILYSNGNCNREKSIEITIELCDFEPGIPNAFRPASYPPNNTFKPVFGPVIPESFEMMIFNSWGQQIFTTNDFSLGWDGTYKGQAQPQGNYVYVVRYNIAATTLGSGLTKEVRGSVLLIR